MIGAIHNRRLEAHDREPGDDAALRRLADAALDRLDEILRDRATHDFVLNNHIFGRVFGQRLDFDHRVPILPATPCLADEATFAARALQDRLAVRDARRRSLRPPDRG